MSKNETSIAIINKHNGMGLPTILPQMDKKELFNLVQDTTPIAQLVGKEFKIVALIPEMVLVPKNNEYDEGSKDDFVQVFDEDEMVERMRLTMVTDIGVYHSFSITFTGALRKAIEILGEDFVNYTFELTAKPNGKKMTYVVKAK